MSEQTRTTTERKQVELPAAFAANDRGLPEAVFTLRKRLYIKAKQEPRYRFYALYDRIYRPDVLAAAWDLVAANDGAPGVDGVRITDVRNAPQGVDGFLQEIHESLKTKRYRTACRYGVSSYPNRMEGSGHWASRPCAIGWSRRRPS